MRKFLNLPIVRELTRVILALTLGLVLGFIITVIFSKDPIGAYKTLLFGPLTRLNRIGDWLETSISLILSGLAVAIVFRAKLWYIGAEGSVLWGALVSGVIALFLPVPAALRILLAVLGGALAGALWGLIPAYLKAYLNASELVTSLMMNTIAVKLFEFLLKYFIMPPKMRTVTSDLLPPELRIGTFIPDRPIFSSIRAQWVGSTNVSWMVYVTLACVIGVYLLLFKTKFGYELRTMGANPKFASYGGINVKRTMMMTILISGLFAGLAGVHLTMAIHNRLLIDMSAGIGFDGIVVSTLALNNPLGVPFTGLLYGYLRTGADIMERSSDIPRQLVTVIQAAIMLLISAERIMPAIQHRIEENKISKSQNGKSKEGEAHAS